MTWSFKRLFGGKNVGDGVVNVDEMSPVRDRNRVDVEMERLLIRKEKSVLGVEKRLNVGAEKELNAGVKKEWDASDGTVVNGWKVYKMQRTKEGVVKVIKMEEVTGDGHWENGKPDRLVDWDPMDLNLFDGGKISDEDRVVWIKRIAKVRPWVTREKIAQTLGVSLITIKRDIKILEEQGEMAYWGNSRFGHWIVGKEAVSKYTAEELARHK